MKLVDRRGERISLPCSKLNVELPVIVKPSWNVSWLNYSMKYTQILAKVLHRFALNNK